MTQNLFVQSPIGGKEGLDVNIISGQPVPVFIVNNPAGATPQVVTPIFNSITNVASGGPVSLVTYTVPAGLTFYLIRAEFSGSNIALFKLFINSVQFAQKRTWFGEGLNEEFNFESPVNSGVQLNQGDIILITVEQSRPNLGDYEASITGLLVG